MTRYKRKRILHKDTFLLRQIEAAGASYVLSFRDTQQMRNNNHRSGTTNRYRLRKEIDAIYHELGDTFFRRAYRMSYEDFMELCELLNPLLNAFLRSEGQREWAPNGRISNSVRVACAIRYFAGGAVYDIMSQFGLSETAVYNSISMVTDAVNHCQQFELQYPEDEAKQLEIARGFERKSRAGFSCCAGAIDGLLIWIHKPSKKQCEITRQGQKKYFCGRKSKYGLNMQAVCDHNGKFLDVSIMYGGSSSDLLAFEASDLYHKLKNHSLLAPGLCLFGDNAYINTPFMATPYPGRINRHQDDYNFFHSQLRIISEGSFGRLVMRWGFLQKKAPRNFEIEKIIATVLCLCRLHNFCTDKSIARREQLQPPQATPEDEIDIRLDGGIAVRHQYVAEAQREILRPNHLMDGGMHRDNVHRHVRRTQQRREQRDDVVLPREILCAQVVERDVHRPPLPRQNNNNVPNRR